jgi:1-acyl-sn-glycerol-3-phosphate acyltransferase
MNWIKDSFARIWAVWGLVYFAVLMLVFFPIFACCFFWKDPKRSRIAYPFYRLWMAFYLPVIGVRIKIYGESNFAAGQNYIVLCNHNSFIDVPVTSPRIPGPNKTIAKSEMAAIPIFGIIYRLGSVLVNRKDKDSRRKSFVLMKEVLETGLHMCIYPEGTRNKTNQPLKDFQDGAFRLAIDTGKPILPAILTGTRTILPASRSFYLLPGVIRFYFLPPVAITPDMDVETIKNKVHKLMWDAYVAKTTMETAS